MPPIATEDKLVIAHTREWFSSSTMSIDEFASIVLIPALEAAGLLNLEEIKTAEQLLAFRKKQGVQVGRIIRGTRHFPLAWKWVWIDCLPEIHRQACRRELFALAGSLDIPLPSSCAGAKASAASANLHKLMLEFSEMTAASAPAQDGVYDDRDSEPELQHMADEILDWVEAGLRELEAINAGTGIKPGRYKLAERPGVVVSRVVIVE